MEVRCPVNEPAFSGVGGLDVEFGPLGNRVLVFLAVVEVVEDGGYASACMARNDDDIRRICPRQDVGTILCRIHAGVVHRLRINSAVFDTTGLFVELRPNFHVGDHDF